MMLIPGFVSSGTVWKGVVAHYKGAYECHVLTVAGFAGVAPVDGISLKRVRDDVIDYIRARKLQRPVLVGQSLGGVLVLWIAATAPDLVGPIVSVDGVPFLPALLGRPGVTAEMAKAQAEPMKAMYISMTPAQLGAQSRLAFTSMIADPARVDEATGWASASDPRTAGTLMADLMTTDLRGDVSRIKSPLLLIPALKAFAASPDQLAQARAAYEAQVASVPSHEVVVAQTLHFVMFDDLRFLTDTMDGFLHRTDVRSAP